MEIFKRLLGKPALKCLVKNLCERISCNIRYSWQVPVLDHQLPELSDGVFWI